MSCSNCSSFGYQKSFNLPLCPFSQHCEFLIHFFNSGSKGCSVLILHISCLNFRIGCFYRGVDIFYCRMILETKIHGQGLLFATGRSLLLGLFSWKSDKMPMCILIYLYAHTYNFFFLLHLWAYGCSQNRDWIYTIAVILAAEVTTLDP